MRFLRSVGSDSSKPTPTATARSPKRSSRKRAPDVREDLVVQAVREDQEDQEVQAVREDQAVREVQADREDRARSRVASRSNGAHPSFRVARPCATSGINKVFRNSNDRRRDCGACRLSDSLGDFDHSIVHASAKSSRGDRG